MAKGKIVESRRSSQNDTEGEPEQLTKVDCPVKPQGVLKAKIPIEADGRVEAVPIEGEATLDVQGSEDGPCSRVDPKVFSTPKEQRRLLLVANLLPGTSEQEVYARFTRFGPIEGVSIARGELGSSADTALIQFRLFKNLAYLLNVRQKFSHRIQGRKLYLFHFPTEGRLWKKQNDKLRTDSKTSVADTVFPDYPASLIQQFTLPDANLQNSTNLMCSENVIVHPSSEIKEIHKTSTKSQSEDFTWGKTLSPWRPRALALIQLPDSPVTSPEASPNNQSENMGTVLGHVSCSETNYRFNVSVDNSHLTVATSTERAGETNLLVLLRQHRVAQTAQFSLWHA